MRRWLLLSFLALSLAAGGVNAATKKEVAPKKAAATKKAPAKKQAAAKAAPAKKKAVAKKGPLKVDYAQAAEMLGEGLFVGTGSSMPPNLLTMMRRAALKREKRTNVFYLSTFAPKTNFEPNVTDKWHPNLFFVSGSNREAATNGNVTMHRASLFDLSQRLAKDEYAIDTVIVRVSPPDKEGNVSLGTNADLTLPAIRSVLRKGGKIIAEVNPNVPHTKGNRIKYSDLHAVIENQDLLGEHNAILPNLVEKQIAAHVAGLIPDHGATIQIGIGNALNGLGETLKTKKKLALWSEMGGEWLIPLMTGKNPTLKKGTVSFLLGTNKLYDLARNNEHLVVEPTDVVNNPATIAAQANMRSINTALQVDIFGNVNAEQVGKKIISSPGGQPDFMKGASESKDGRSIMALRSIHDATKGSTIVLNLAGPTTTPKNHVDHLVTEWGATKQMRGMTDAERVYQIISVAHPLHRADLAKAAKEAAHLTQAQHDELVRSIAQTIQQAPPEIRRELAGQALAKKLIDQAQHDAAIKGLPAAVAAAPQPAVPAQVAQ